MRFPSVSEKLGGVTYPSVPRDLLKRAENENFPLIGLGALRVFRKDLDELEDAILLRAREMGASTTDIGEALGLTRQAAYARLKHALERHAEAPLDHEDTIVVPDTEPTTP